jgi:hypothetical protein
VEKGDEGSWLFITVKADQLPSLRPLITVWLDIAISAIMSLKPDHGRRLYCVVDELPTLQKLPSLSDFWPAPVNMVAAAYWASVLPQLIATYGKEDAVAITGYCSTWVALKANDFDTADHVSKNMGQVEQVEANEGMSYGVNDMRDGINLSRIQVTRPLVLATQVQNLPNFYGFLRFGRNVPVVTFTDAYNTLPDVAPGFAERLAPPQPHEKAAQLILLAQAESKLREAAHDQARRTARTGCPACATSCRAIISLRGACYQGTACKIPKNCQSR